MNSKLIYLMVGFLSKGQKIGKRYASETNMIGWRLAKCKKTSLSTCIFFCSGGQTRTDVRQLTDMSPNNYFKISRKNCLPLLDFNSFSLFMAAAFVSKNST